MAQGVANLSQDERMQEVLRMLETRDSVHVAELAKAFAVSEVTVRSDLGQLARQGLVARVRGGVRPLQRGQSELGFDFRLRLEVERKQAIARAAASMVGRGRGGRTRLEHDRLLPGARAAREAGARRRHQRPPDRGSARRCAGDHRARHRRDAPAPRDVARRRPRGRRPACDEDQQGLPRARAA